MRSYPLVAIASCVGAAISPAPASADCPVIDGAIELSRLYPEVNRISGDVRCYGAGPAGGDRFIVGETGDGVFDADHSLVGGPVILGAGDPAAGADAGPYLGVGIAPGVTGQLGGRFEYRVEGADTATRVDIGRGGTGILGIRYNRVNLAILDATASPGSGHASGEVLTIGSEGGIGLLNGWDANIVIDSGSGATAIIGLNGGQGTASLNSYGQLALRDRDPDPGGPGAMLAVGMNTDGTSGGVGHVSTGGDLSSASVFADAAPARLLIGHGAGAVGRFISGSEYGKSSVRSGGDASMVVGAGEGAIGTASTGWYDGFIVHGGRTSVVDIGVDHGTGSVSIGGGGLLRVTGPGARINVGAAFADAGRPVGGTGALSVYGNSYAHFFTRSSVSVTGDIVVGAPESMGGGVASGHLSMGGGGVIVADSVIVGTGGGFDGSSARLRADGSFNVDGTIDMFDFDGAKVTGDVVLDGGAMTAGGPGVGLFLIEGDFRSLGGFLEIDVAGTDPGWFDVIRVSGDFHGAAPFSVGLNFIRDFMPVAGDSFAFLELAGDAADLEALVAASLILIEDRGLPVGSQVSLAYGDGKLSAVVDFVGAVIPTDPGDPMPAPVPLPGSLGLLLSGLFMTSIMASIMAERRRSRAARRQGYRNRQSSTDPMAAPQQRGRGPEAGGDG